MHDSVRKKLIQDVFAPKRGEKFLLMTDVSHDDVIVPDESERAEMVKNWYKDIFDLSLNVGFETCLMRYEATGKHGKPLDGQNALCGTRRVDNIMEEIEKYDIVLAMTGYSPTSTVYQSIKNSKGRMRGATMPGIVQRMEDTALSADYSKIGDTARMITEKLNRAIAANIDFSTGEELHIDLRYHTAEADAGECRSHGDFINLPSGEGLKAPWEGSEQYPSDTYGQWPVMINSEKIIFSVKHGRIKKVVVKGPESARMEAYFRADPMRGIFAELGIGCNDKAVVWGNVLEDEKAGLHLAYGMNKHIGGSIGPEMFKSIDTVVHQDIVYAKGCPITGTLTLIYGDGEEILVKNGTLIK